jgi:hypothetical protein
MVGRAVCRAIAAAFLALPANNALAGDSPGDFAGTYNGSQMEVGTELRLEPDGRYE